MPLDLSVMQPEPFPHPVMMRSDLYPRRQPSREEKWGICPGSVCGALRESVGLPLSSRCCPGQGDFPAAWREVLLRTLGTEERIGLSAEGGFQPTWSLAAVVGIQSTFSASTFPAGCTPASCATCRKDCALRPAPEA